MGLNASLLYMEKTENAYLIEIARLYEEIRKEAYGERKGGNKKLPPNIHNYARFVQLLYQMVWDFVEHFSNDQDATHIALLYDLEREILHELDVLKEKNLNNERKQEILELYYLRIGSDLQMILPKRNSNI